MSKQINQGPGEHLSVLRLLPSLITFIALCLGLSAIQNALNGRFQTAVLLIFIAGLFDGIDGRVARAIKAEGVFGANLDSLSDMASFGIASPVVLYLWSTKSVKMLGWASTLVFAISMMIRLARFNTEILPQENQDNVARKSGFFKGMPAPAAAIGNLIPICISIEFDIDPSSLKYLSIVNSILVSAFMISTIPTPSAKNLKIKRGNAFWLLLISNITVVTILLQPIKAILLMYFTYLLSIPVTNLYNKRHATKGP